MCDVPKLAGLISPHEADPAFITSATCRPVSKILDAQDLTMRIHWAIRDAMLHQDGTVPEDLDWSTDKEFVPGPLCFAVGVVEQRHHTLNWLINFCNPKDWDELTTHT